MPDIPDETAAFVAGLRALADFYEANPDFPAPFEATHPSGVEVTVFSHQGAEEFADLTRRLGGNRDKEYTDSAVTVTRPFGGGIHLEIYAARRNVCERVKVGTRTVTKPDPDALIEVEEDVYEWQCHDSILDDSAKQAEVSR